MSRRRVAVAAVVLVSAPSAARADERATAQQLFQQGKELLRAGDVAHACPKLEAAAQLTSTPGVRLNLADCWTALGRTASAWTKFDEALRMAELQGDAVAAESARKGRAQLESQLSYATVVVSADAAVSGLVLTRDGQPLPTAAWGVAIPVDPGKHEISADAPGRRSWSTTETVGGPGTRGTTTIPVLATAQNGPLISPGAAPLAADAHPSDTAPSAAGRTQRLAGWLTGGLGVVGLGLGAGFAIDALVERGQYRPSVTSAGNCANLACQSESHAAATAGNVATGAFIAGGALVATGVVLVLTSPSGRHAPATGIIPLVTPQAVGMALTGEW